MESGVPPLRPQGLLLDLHSCSSMDVESVKSPCASRSASPLSLTKMSKHSLVLHYRFQSSQNNKEGEIQGRDLFPLVTSVYVVGAFEADWTHLVQIRFSQ